MKRLIVFVVVLGLAISSVMFQLPPATAQTQNCFLQIFNIQGYYRAVQGSAVVSDTVYLPSSPSSGRLTINKGVTGIVNLQFSTNANFSPSTTYSTNYFVNCVDDNKEFGGACDRLGVDIYDVAVTPGAIARLKVFKNDQVVLQQDYTSSVISPIQVIVPADEDPNAYYSYELRCIGSSAVCIAANASASASADPGTLLAKGPMSYVCLSASGPSHEGAPLGRMLVTVPLYWAPRADAASTFFAEAGQTFKVLGSDDGFARIALANQVYWVPAEAIGLCAEMFCRD